MCIFQAAKGTAPGKKGQSQIISHSLTVLFSLTLILAVLTTMNKIESDYAGFAGSFQARDVCSLIKTSAEKIHNPLTGNVSMNITEEMGLCVLDLPQKIGNEAYNVMFFNRTVKVENSVTSQVCEIGINATFSGVSSGGRTRLRWLFGNGTDALVIEKA